MVEGKQVKKVQLFGCVFAIAAIALISAPARADQLDFTFNLSGCSGGCTVPAGSVILTQDGSSVDVEVDLSHGNFIDAGSHTSFVFDINGAPQIKVSNLSAGFSWPADSTTNSPFGTFDYGIDCIATGTPGLPSGTPTCGPGASNQVPPPLKFTVSLANGNALNISDFGSDLYSSGGTTHNVFFAADIYDTTTGNTGAVGAQVPEPSTLALLGCTLVGVTAMRRRLKHRL